MTDSPPGGRGVLTALLVVTAAVLARGLFGQFVYDDLPLIVENPAFQSLRDPWAIASQPLWQDRHGYWRPLTGLAFALGNTLGGVMGIHGLALLVHLAAVTVAYRLAATLTGSASGAIWVASLFALHPIQVEGVAWATAINDPLWGLWGLLCLRGTLAWWRRGSTGTPVCTFVCFALALLSKENALALLPLLAMLDLATRSRRAAAPMHKVPTPAPAPASARRSMLYGGLLVILAGYFAARVLVFGSFDAGLGRAVANPAYVGARLLTGGIEVLGQSIQLLVAPWPLSPFRSLAAVGATSVLVVSIVWILALVLGLAWASKSHRHLLMFGLGTVLVVLLPVAWRFHMLGSRPIQDRYLYLAVFGLALAFAPRKASRPHAIIGCGLVAIFAVFSAIQVGIWRDQEHLVNHGLSLDPGSSTLRTMRGNSALRRYRTTSRPDDLRQAEVDYRHVLANAPTRHIGRQDAQIGLAWCAVYRERFATAIRRFQAVTEDPDAPAQAFAGLGIALACVDRFQDAERSLRRAVALAPLDGTIHFNLGRLYAQMDRLDQARHHLQRALRLQPHNQQAARLLDTLR